MSFPSITHQKKDLQYHKDFGIAILKGTINEDWAIKYRVMQECYKFFNSGSNGELTQFLQRSADNSELPAMWLSVSSLKEKIEALVGELEERGNDIRVRALSPEAAARKFDAKEDLRVQRRLQKVTQFAEQQTGLPLQDNDNVPQTDLELDEYIDYKYKDKAAIIADIGLKALAKRNSWDSKRVQWFRDVWIAGMTVNRNEIVRGIPRPFHVDPLCFIFDPNITDDEGSDATYFGEIYYMGQAEACERYNLTKEEMEQAHIGYQNFLGNTGGVLPTVPVSETFYDAVPRETVSWFKDINGTPRVMVARMVWADTKTATYKNEKNPKYGTEHLQELKEDEVRKKKSTIVTDKMKVWRQITLIGGVIVREWGLCPNQPMDLDNLQETQSPYDIWIPNYLAGNKTSKVERVVNLELLRDMAMYNLQLAMNRAGGKGFIYDLALKPENMTFEQVASYLKTMGITAINSKEYQMVNGMNAMQAIDLSMSDSIGKYVEIMSFLDNQINSMIGTSPERQGQVTAASQAVGVTQMALAQSSMVTAPYFKGFERFCSRIQAKQAKLMRMAMADKELFAPIIGDAGIDFLKENIDMELEEIGVIVESLPPLLRDKSTLDNLVMAAVQSQQMSAADAAALLLEPDLRVALRKLQRKDYLKKIIEQKAAEAEQQRQQEFEQKMAQIDMQKQQMAQQGQLQLQEAKNQGATERTLIQGKVRLNEKKIDMLTP